MRVQKSSSRNPKYPSKRQFLAAALGVGALAAVVARAEPPKLGGVPLPPKPATNEVRLRGDIAVEPKSTNAVPCKPAVTNAPTVSFSLPGRMPDKPAPTK